jgi:hypothetical protein
MNILSLLIFLQHSPKQDRSESDNLTRRKKKKNNFIWKTFSGALQTNWLHSISALPFTPVHAVNERHSWPRLPSIFLFFGVCYPPLYYTEHSIDPATLRIDQKGGITHKKKGKVKGEKKSRREIGSTSLGRHFHGRLVAPFFFFCFSRHVYIYTP